MAKYVLLTEVKREANDVEWWMDQTNTTEETVQFFNSFEEAKTAMRKTVKRVVKNCDFFPLKNGGYVPIEQHMESYLDGDGENIRSLGKVICNAINKTDYFCEGLEDIKDTDNGDRYYAIVGNESDILVDYYGIALKMNIHNMTDAVKSYYFDYSEFDDYGVLINAISIRLLNNAKKRKQKNVTEKKKNYDTVTFGHYIQDNDGQELSPLSWRVLDKKDGMALLVTEKVIDYIQFSAKKNNNWEKSDILKWLNKDFADCAFSNQEKNLIQKSVSGKKVFLLSLDEYHKYFLNLQDTRANYTDHARNKAYGHPNAKTREPYDAFWWLRTANEEGWRAGADSSVYLYHVCSDGTVNPFKRAEWSNGVRPAIWVNLNDAITLK